MEHRVETKIEDLSASVFHKLLMKYRYSDPNYDVIDSTSWFNGIVHIACFVNKDHAEEFNSLLQIYYSLQRWVPTIGNVRIDAALDVLKNLKLIKG